ncbi:response regulator [Haliangium sp.]|uniref:response regulator n=1 Tax=Haliangium sp. TaxID=2663208 RepID=UPI003D0DD6D7
MTRAAMQVSAQALRCQRFEKNYLLNLGDSERRRAYLDRWAEAWKQTVAAIDTLTDHGADPGTPDRWRAHAEAYRDGFAAVVRRVDAGELSDPAAVARAAASLEEPLRSLVADADGLARAHLEAADGGREQLDASVRAGTIAFALLALGLAVGLLGLGVFSSQRLLGRIGALAGGARRVADGDLSVRVAIDSGDELGDLGTAFNHMAESLALDRRDLEQALQAAAAAARAKAEFLATMSHEIRTPLSGVIGMAELLLGTRLSGEQREFAQSLSTAAEALLSLVNDILDFSKFESGNIELDSVSFDLQSLAEDVVQILSSRARAGRIDLVSSYDDALPRFFLGDPGRIRQILLNLVGNAVKFTDEGHVLLAISAAAPLADDAPTKIRFVIEDTGIGMPADSLPHIFDRFVQVSSEDVRRAGGTGLGLAISRQLVEAMGGHLTVESELGRGSTFSYVLPLPIDPEPPSAVLPSADLAGAHIAIVDDSEVNRRILVGLVQSWNATVDAYADGTSALAGMRRAAAKHPFDIAIIDNRMPDMDGASLGRHIQEAAGLGEIRLVLLTSAPRQGDGRRYQELGFAAYLTKPTKRAVLMDTLSAVLGAKREGIPVPMVTRHRLAESQAVRRATMPAIPIDALGAITTPAGTHPAQAPARPRARILLVDDTSVNRRLASKMLEKLGCAVDVAANGTEAVERFRAGRYDLVLMDCQMPQMDGYEATEQIRNHERGRGDGGAHTPIVAMTANAMPEDRARCLDAGMDDYIPKPIRQATLRSALARWLPGAPSHPVQQG